MEIGNRIALAKTIVKRLDGIRFDGDNHVEVLKWVGMGSICKIEYELGGIAFSIYAPNNKKWFYLQPGQYVTKNSNEDVTVYSNLDLQEFYDNGWFNVPYRKE